ncbi:unnamed protein product [Caenorhabditis auriculariae]|uniref:Uncharacterized protein n=1 Tax=Caenorhabditis auriculariae TaxID=2777116 RepID=A0A8S1HEB1_9PELO|nr:unnamed protein product [Caenorhabditis auriculariae]
MNQIYNFISTCDSVSVRTDETVVVMCIIYSICAVIVYFLHTFFIIWLHFHFVRILKSTYREDKKQTYYAAVPILEMGSILCGFLYHFASLLPKSLLNNSMTAAVIAGAFAMFVYSLPLFISIIDAILCVQRIFVFFDILPQFSKNFKLVTIILTLVLCPALTYLTNRSMFYSNRVFGKYQLYLISEQTNSEASHVLDKEAQESYAFYWKMLPTQKTNRRQFCPHKIEQSEEFGALLASVFNDHSKICVFPCNTAKIFPFSLLPPEMNSGTRKLSLTLSEDDLRPHMRKAKSSQRSFTVVTPFENSPAPSPHKSQTIADLNREHEERELRKKKIVEEIEKKKKEELEEKLEKERKEQEQAEIYRQRHQIERPSSNMALEGNLTRRRFSDKKYFNWDSEEDNDVPKDPDSVSIKPFSKKHQDRATEHCHLCYLARKADNTLTILLASAVAAQYPSVNGFCPSGFYLHPASQCFVNSIYYGQTVNGYCPSPTVPGDGLCYQISSQLYFGACVNSFCPIGYTCSQTTAYTYCCVPGGK